MTITLYQFPISHYCEKVRWALDYKGLEYDVKNLLPGLHVRTTLKMARKSTVPLLDHDGVIVQGSSQIISYLDDTFPEKKLTPVNPSEAQEAKEWERYLDDEIGVHLRRYMYHYLLQQPGLVVGFFTQGGPWWSKPFYRVMFPKVAKLMRKHMQIDAETAAASKLRVEAALERVCAAVAQRGFLAGRSFSRADLTAAALLAPIFMPVKYGLQWPATLPEPLKTELAGYRQQLDWAEELYRQYR